MGSKAKNKAKNRQKQAVKTPKTAAANDSVANEVKSKDEVTDPELVSALAAMVEAEAEVSTLPTELHAETINLVEKNADGPANVTVTAEPKPVIQEPVDQELESKLEQVKQEQVSVTSEPVKLEIEKSEPAQSVESELVDMEQVDTLKVEDDLVTHESERKSWEASVSVPMAPANTREEDDPTQHEVPPMPVLTHFKDPGNLESLQDDFYQRLTSAGKQVQQEPGVGALDHAGKSDCEDEVLSFEQDANKAFNGMVSEELAHEAEENAVLGKPLNTSAFEEFDRELDKKLQEIDSDEEFINTIIPSNAPPPEPASETIVEAAIPPQQEPENEEEDDFFRAINPPGAKPTAEQNVAEPLAQPVTEPAVEPVAEPVVDTIDTLEPLAGRVEKKKQDEIQDDFLKAIQKNEHNNAEEEDDFFKAIQKKAKEEPKAEEPKAEELVEDEEEDDFFKALKKDDKPQLELDLDDEFLDDDDLDESMTTEPHLNTTRSESLAFLESDDELLPDEEEPAPAPLVESARPSLRQKSSVAEFHTESNSFDLPQEMMPKQKPRRQTPTMLSRTATPTNVPTVGGPTLLAQVSSRSVPPSQRQAPPARAARSQASKYVPVGGAAQASAPPSLVPVATQPGLRSNADPPAAASVPISPTSVPPASAVVPAPFKRASNPDPFGFPGLNRAPPRRASRTKAPLAPPAAQTTHQVPPMARQLPHTAHQVPPGAQPVHQQVPQQPQQSQQRMPLSSQPPFQSVVPRRAFSTRPARAKYARAADAATVANPYAPDTHDISAGQPVIYQPTHPAPLEQHSVRQPVGQAAFGHPQAGLPTSVLGQPLGQPLQPVQSAPVQPVQPVLAQPVTPAEPVHVDLSPASLNKLPLPLLGPKGPMKNKKKELERWIKERMADLEGALPGHLLYNILLQLLIADTPEKRKALVCEALNDRHSNLRLVSASGGPHSAPAGDDINAIFAKLGDGDTAGALKSALDSKSFAHALVIAQFSGPSEWNRTVTEFCTREIRATAAPLAFIYRARAAPTPEAGAAAISELEVKNEQGLLDSAKTDLNLSHWVECVAAIYAGTAPETATSGAANGSAGPNSAIRAMGNLLVQRGLVEEGHACYMLAGVSFGPEFPLPLVAPGSTPLFDCCILAEIYEFVVGRGSAGLLQPKLSFAETLADAGYAKQGLKIAENITAVLRSSKNAPPQLVEAAGSLATRCSATAEPAGGWLTRKLSIPNFEKAWVHSFNKFVSGEDDVEGVVLPNGPNSAPNGAPNGAANGMPPNGTSSSALGTQLMGTPVPGTPGTPGNHNLLAPNTAFAPKRPLSASSTDIQSLEFIPLQRQSSTPGPEFRTASPAVRPPSGFGTPLPEVVEEVPQVPPQPQYVQSQNTPTPQSHHAQYAYRDYALESQQPQQNIYTPQQQFSEPFIQPYTQPLQSQPQVQPGEPGFEQYVQQMYSQPVPPVQPLQSAQQPQQYAQQAKPYAQQVTPSPYGVPTQLAHSAEPSQPAPVQHALVQPPQSVPAEPAASAAQPEVKKIDDKKDDKSEKKGWFSWLKKEDPNKPIEVKLGGSSSQMYYDPELKRWLKKGEPKPDAKAGPPPSPRVASVNAPAPTGTPMAVPPGAVPGAVPSGTPSGAPSIGALPSLAPPGASLSPAAGTPPTGKPLVSGSGGIDDLLAASATVGRQRRPARSRYVKTTSTGMPEGM